MEGQRLQVKERLRGGLRFAFRPILKVLDIRFNNLQARLVQIEQRLQDQDRRLGDFERHITTDVQTAVEVLLTHQRGTAILQERIAELHRLMSGRSELTDSAPADLPSP